MEKLQNCLYALTLAGGLATSEAIAEEHPSQQGEHDPAPAVEQLPENTSRMISAVIAPKCADKENEAATLYCQLELVTQRSLDLMISLNTVSEILIEDISRTLPSTPGLETEFHQFQSRLKQLRTRIETFQKECNGTKVNESLRCFAFEAWPFYKEAEVKDIDRNDEDQWTVNMMKIMLFRNSTFFGVQKSIIDDIKELRRDLLTFYEQNRLPVDAVCPKTFHESKTSECKRRYEGIKSELSKEPNMNLIGQERFD